MPAPRSKQSDAYVAMLEVLVEARKKAGMTQAQVSEALHRPQSFVAKIENKERRLDPVEFIAFARAIKMEPEKLIAAVAKRLPKGNNILD